MDPLGFSINIFEANLKRLPVVPCRRRRRRRQKNLVPLRIFKIDCHVSSPHSSEQMVVKHAMLFATCLNNATILAEPEPIL